MKLKAIFWT